MNKKTVEANVLEVRPGALFLVEYEEKQILAYLGGKMRFHHIRILIGDRVLVELDPYHGKATNRIIQRLPVV